MLRIVDGVALVGKESPDRWAVSVRTFADGQVEASIRKQIDWSQAEWDPAKHARDLLDYLGPERYAQRLAEEEADRAEANAKRAARRAKTRVRHLVKAQGLDTLLTLTYRACVTDLQVCRGHVAAFVRRMRKALDGFSYVAAYELQKRGAWHVHLAVHRLPRTLAACNGVKVKSYNVVRAIWRDVVGELGGNIDQSRRRRTAHKSAARVASYLSKYMLKDWQAEQWGKEANRYTCSKGARVPDAVVVYLKADALHELVGLVFVDLGAPGLGVVSGWVSPFGDAAYFAAELQPPQT